MGGETINSKPLGPMKPSTQLETASNNKYDLTPGLLPGLSNLCIFSTNEPHLRLSSAGSYTEHCWRCSYYQCVPWLPQQKKIVLVVQYLCFVCVYTSAGTRDWYQCWYEHWYQISDQSSMTKSLVPAWYQYQAGIKNKLIPDQHWYIPIY